MKKFGKILFVGALVAAFAVGCQSKENKKDTDAVAEVTKAVEEEVTITVAPEVNNEETKDDEKGLEGDSISYPYTYVDAAQRELVVEAEPVRIATNYLPLWETMYMLGITPVAASGSENYMATWDPFIGIEFGEVIDLGTAEINLELLLEVQPDLFLFQAADPSSIDIANYEKIAPVAVFGGDTKMDWKLSLRRVGELVGRSDKAEEVIAEFDSKIDEARAKLQEKYAGQTVLQISIMDADRYYCAYRPMLYDKEEGLGLTAPEGYTTSESYEQVSLEAIAAMNADYIFVNVFDGDEAIYEEVTKNSVWQSLKAVQDNHVTRLDGAGHAPSGMATQYTVDVIVDTLLSE